MFDDISISYGLMVFVGYFLKRIFDSYAQVKLRRPPFLPLKEGCQCHCNQDGKGEIFLGGLLFFYEKVEFLLYYGHGWVISQIFS